MEQLKTEIMAMVSRISDQKKLELIHRFLIRILRDKKESSARITLFYFGIRPEMLPPSF